MFIDSKMNAVDKLIEGLDNKSPLSEDLFISATLQCPSCVIEAIKDKWTVTINDSNYKVDGLITLLSKRRRERDLREYFQ